MKFEKDINLVETELKNLLSSSGIDPNLYGSGTAKTVSDLAKEIIDGESEIINVGGKLERRIGAVAISLLFINDDGDLLKLFENKQVFRDGRVRNREPLYGTSIVEKIHAGEDKKAAMARGVLEEIGVDIGNVIVDEPELRSRLRDSESYPGLQTNQETYVFPDVVINEGDFKPEGYVEVQDNKSTYFVWKREE